MSQLSDDGGRRWLSRRTLILVSNLVSIACLIWVLHDMDLASLIEDIKSMHWGWVALAVASDIFVYVWQGYRWSLLLNPVAPTPVWQSVRAIYVGLFANEVLPLRSGEVIRCYLQARWSKLPFTVALSSAVIERIFDGLWLVGLLFVTTRYVKLPQFLVDGAALLAGILAAAAVVLAVVMFHKHRAHAAMAGNRFLRNIRVLVDDLHLIGNSRQFYLAGIASLPYLLLQVVPIYALVRGYGLEITLGGAFVLMVILRLGTVVPQAPGNLGTFQALMVLGLHLFGIETGLAKRFSIVLWGAITLPLLIAGFIALAITEFKIGELRREAETDLANSRNARADK
ncbi:MAG: flippase-like domain-containing protein [Acidobacteria bacterium]|nr:flippase-like domain-containing protein [Acidobacteriota bacterium]